MVLIPFLKSSEREPKSLPPLLPCSLCFLCFDSPSKSLVTKDKWYKSVETEVTLKSTDEATIEDVRASDALILGSPIRHRTADARIKKLLKIPSNNSG